MSRTGFHNARPTEPPRDKWKPVPGWEGLYVAHIDGRIRSLDRIVTTRGGWTQRFYGRELSPSLADRYLAIDLSRDAGTERWYVHALIAHTFIGPRPDGLVVCHNDGNTTHNAASNLRYDSRSENNRDAVRHGTNPLSARTHCKYGHEFNATNTAHLPSRKGRTCLTCARARGAAHMRAKRAAQKESAA